MGTKAMRGFDLSLPSGIRPFQLAVPWYPVERVSAVLKSGLMKISVILPAFNEALELPETLRRVAAIPEVFEWIVVDGGSTDATVSVAATAGARVVSSAKGRGQQLRTGALAAQGDVFLFLHADTWVTPGAGRAIGRALADPEVVGGGFWKDFRDPHWMMRGSRFRCWTRLHLFGRIAADQAIFVRRNSLEQMGGFPAQPLMEEFELCRRLRSIGRLVLANERVSTSSRRWRSRGVLRTYFRMGCIVALYTLGTSPERLVRLYDSEPPRSDPGTRSKIKGPKERSGASAVES